MTTSRSIHQLPGFLKMGMYLSEALIVDVLFSVFYKGILCPESQGLFDVNNLYGLMSMSLVVSYVLGVFVRPISFYYRSDRRGSIFSNVSTCVAVMAMSYWGFALLFSFNDRFQTLRILEVFICIFVALLSWRFFCRALIQTLRSQGRNAHRVVFVGKNNAILELFEEMKHRFYGYRVEGYFSDEPFEDCPQGLTLLGTVADVAPYVASHPEIQQLYCGLSSVRSTEIRHIIDVCEHNCVRFFNIPQLRNYLKRRMQLEFLGSVPVLSIREDPLSSLSNRILKRTFDIVVSSLVMIPFWLIIYPVVAIIGHKMQPGPVFFKQKRNGLNGEVFYCYKFRSMKVNADSDKVQATKDDPRKTPFGNFLRKSSIDELPQFINVLKGDMSIVGPRPHMVAHTEEYSALIDKYMVRHWVRPGITGWAQVNGARGETKELWQMEDRIRKDIWYVENWTFFLDLKIMFLTVWNVVAGDKQAY